MKTKCQKGSISELFTARLASKADNRLIIAPKDGEPLVYKLSGWMELAIMSDSGIDDSTSVSMSHVRVQTINLDATIRNRCSPWVPPTMHLSLALDEEPMATVDPESDKAVLQVPLTLDYPGLKEFVDRRISSSPADMDSSLGITMPSGQPLWLDLALDLTTKLEDGAFVGLGSGLIEPIPGLQGESTVPATICLGGECKTGLRCLEVCVRVNVAKKGGKRVKSKKQVKSLFDKVNAIWGCPGQCCITFKLKDSPAPAKLPSSVTVSDSDYKTGWPTIRKINRAAKCYNVYLVDTLMYPGNRKGRGITGFGAPDNISILATKGRKDADLVTAIAHELGHALCLARGDKTSAKGVKSHSSVATNLMSEDGGGNNLNADQCKAARGCDDVTLTKGADECSGKPRERII